MTNWHAPDPTTRSVDHERLKAWPLKIKIAVAGLSGLISVGGATLIMSYKVNDARSATASIGGSPISATAFDQPSSATTTSPPSTTSEPDAPSTTTPTGTQPTPPPAPPPAPTTPAPQTTPAPSPTTVAPRTTPPTTHPPAPTWIPAANDACSQTIAAIDGANALELTQGVTQTADATSWLANTLYDLRGAPSVVSAAATTLATAADRYTYSLQLLSLGQNATAKQMAVEANDLLNKAMSSLANAGARSCYP